MRVNSNYETQLLTSINVIQLRQQTDLQQLATGKRVNTPSDDPTAAALEVGNLAATADAAQYQRNISSTQTMLQSASTALTSVVTNLTSALTQGVQAANGITTADQRTQLAVTVSGIRDQIIALANTSVQGVYLFAGTASSKPPFQLNSDPTTGVTYSGNSGTNSVPVDNNQTVQSNIPGDTIFGASTGNVMQSLTDLINGLQSNSVSAITAATTSITNSLSAVSLQQESYSSTINRLTADNTALQNDTVTLKSLENSLVGADPATVIIDLTQSQTTLQAALQATAKVVPMSLLNYL